MSRHKLRAWDVLLREEARASGRSEPETVIARARGRARTAARSLRRTLKQRGVAPQAWPRLICLELIRVAPQLSNRTIAEIAGMTHPTVAVVRRGFTTPKEDNLPAQTVFLAEIPDEKCENEVMELIDLSRARRSSRRRRPRPSGDFFTALYASTETNAAQHFIGDAAMLDVDQLVAEGKAWGIVRRREPVGRAALVYAFPVQTERRAA